MPASLALRLIVAASIALAIGASAYGQPATEPPALRGQQSADAPVPVPAPAPTARSALMSPISPAAPRFAWDSAPRLTGFAANEAPGQCRRACGANYFQCSGDDSDGECSRAWVQCLTACPH